MLIPKPYFDHILFLAPTPPDPPYLTTHQISYALSLKNKQTSKNKGQTKKTPNFFLKKDMF